MKSAKILLTFALCALVFSSCKKEYLYEHYNENYIEFENTTVEKSYEAQEFTVEVKTNAYLINVREQYTDEEATGWIKEAWFEEGMLHISIRENITTEDRSAEITLSARDVKDAVLTLVQKGAAEPGDPWKVDYAYEWNDSWTLRNYMYSGVKYEPLNWGENGLRPWDRYFLVWETSGKYTLGHVLRGETLAAFAGKKLVRIEYQTNNLMYNVTVGMATLKESDNTALPGWKKKEPVYTIDEVICEQKFDDLDGWLKFEPKEEYIIPADKPVMIFAKVFGNGGMYPANGGFNAMLWVAPQPVNKLVPLYFNDENADGKDMFLMTAGGGVEFNFTVSPSLFE